jgi:hypothetical protein
MHCAVQRMTMEKIRPEYEARGVTIMRVNVDTEREALGVSGIRRRSTLIALKGTRELGRAQWLNTEPAVAGFLDAMLASCDMK